MTLKKKMLRENVTGIVGDSTACVFGRAVSIWTPEFEEFAIMAKDDETLDRAYKSLYPDGKLNRSLIYSVVLLQANKVTLEDDDL